MLALAVLLAGAATPAPPTGAGEDDLVRMSREIDRLRRELDALARQERSVLGDLDRIDTELRLRRAESSEVQLRLTRSQAEAAEHAGRIQALESSRSGRERALAFRMRELYIRGRDRGFRLLLGQDDSRRLLHGLQAAARMMERDTAEVRAWRADLGRLRTEQAELAAENDRQAALGTEVDRASAALASALVERRRVLEGIRGDRRRHETAIAELESASRELGQMLASGPGGGPSLNPRRFQGLLDWPAQGRVSAGFGKAVDALRHTFVPYPGLDIEAEAGTPFRSVFDGKVVYASWLRGYGLTAIVDHGSGLASVYAHAAALYVGAGETVTRGQVLGSVGDTGSLRGPYLYFELRDGGRPIDPAAWLRHP